MSKPTPLTATHESHPSEARDQWLKAHPLSTIGLRQHGKMLRPWSPRKIKPFVRKHWIDVSEFEPRPFRSYTAFFDRRFLPGKWSFPSDPNEIRDVFERVCLTHILLYWHDFMAKLDRLRPRLDLKSLKKGR